MIGEVANSEISDCESCGGKMYPPIETSEI